MAKINYVEEFGKRVKHTLKKNNYSYDRMISLIKDKNISARKLYMHVNLACTKILYTRDSACTRILHARLNTRLTKYQI